MEWMGPSMNSEWEAGWNLPSALFGDDQCKRARALVQMVGGALTSTGLLFSLHSATCFISSVSVYIFQWPNRIALISLFNGSKISWGGGAVELGGRAKMRSAIGSVRGCKC